MEAKKNNSAFDDSLNNFLTMITRTVPAPLMLIKAWTEDWV